MLNAVQDTNICIPVPNFYLDMRLPSSHEGSSLLLCGLYILESLATECLRLVMCLNFQSVKVSLDNEISLKVLNFLNYYIIEYSSVCACTHQ